MKGYKWVNNGDIQKQVPPERLQEFLDNGFFPGQLKSRVDRSWYTNGIEDRHFINQPIPDGWYKGRTNYGNWTTKNKISITDGRVVHYINPGEHIPDGFEIGGLPKSDEHKSKISGRLKGKTKSEKHCKNLSNSHKTEEYKNKIENTCLERYGVRNPFQLESTIAINQSQEAIKKKNDTKRKNGTFNSSRLEEAFFKKLCDVYEEEDILKQYSDSRYPFSCDFYIKPEDLFIEINGFATHGDHPFDKNCKEDLNYKKSLEEKNDGWSKNILNVWAEKDPLKIETAYKNHLNYIVFYGMNIDTPVIIQVDKTKKFKLLNSIL